MKNYRPAHSVRGFTDHERALLDDLSTSYWLKEQIVASYNRDLCDALNDAHILLDVLEKRFAIVTSGPRC